MDEYRHCANITFMGFLGKTDLNRILMGAKAVIVTSQWYETFGMVVVEAFSCRVPVIVGDIGNVASLVEDGVNGIKFQYDSGEALKQAVMCFERMDHDTMGQAAYMKYLNEFVEGKNYSCIEAKWCREYLKENDIRNVELRGHASNKDGLMIGVGAGFAYRAGQLKSVPEWMQKNNLEWFHRLMQESGRLLGWYGRTNRKFILNACIRGW